jgi:DNA (cytosine-5)-methyltransferase 1
VASFPTADPAAAVARAGPPAPMTFLSLFAGVGGFDLGLERAGMHCAGQVEINPTARRILARRFPEVPRHDDVRTTIGWWQAEPRPGVDLVCAGFPCQDLSTAGRRAGLAGERSGLFFDLARTVGALHPRWVLLENVPGLLSSNRGRDFGTVLDTLAELGYGLAWRVLDSRFFGVPQRRRRVFVVGCLGAVCPHDLLFEPSPGPDDPAARGAPGPADPIPPAPGAARGRRLTAPPHGAASTPWVLSVSQSYNGDLSVSEAAATLVGGGSKPGTGYAAVLVSSDQQRSPGACAMADRRAQSSATAAPSSGIIWRLTPRECERLQGFPDDWTALDDRGRPVSDTARYRAMGNAVTVPVITWLGRRLVACDLAEQREPSRPTVRAISP